MSTHRYVALLSLLAVLVGLVLLFVPVTVRTADCGSLIDPDTRGPGLRDAYMGRSGSTELCDDAMSSRRGWTLALLIGGVVVGVGALVISRQKKTPEPLS